MIVSALVIAQLQYDGCIRIFQMQASPERPLTIAVADEFDEPHSGPFHFLDEQHQQEFAQGFGKCRAWKLPESQFAITGGEYHFQTSWQGIPTQPQCLSCYSLSLPEFAVPTEIKFKDPHSGREYFKNVIRDNQRSCFTVYLECLSSFGVFDFEAEVRFRSDRENFRSAKYTDDYVRRGGNRIKSLERLVPRDFQHAVQQFFSRCHEAPEPPSDGKPPQLTFPPSVTLISADRVEVLGEHTSRSSAEPKAKKPKSLKQLPQKETDYSQWFEQARLTDKQREVISLRVEYSLGFSEIARRLGLNRATVQEHYAKAEMKLQQARGALKRPPKTF